MKPTPPPHHRRMSVHHDATVADITRVTGISFDEELRKYSVRNSGVSVYNNAHLVDRITGGIITRVLASYSISLCRPISPVSTFNSMCENLGFGFSVFARMFDKYSKTRLHYKLRPLAYPWEFDNISRTITEMGAIVVLPSSVNQHDPFAGLASAIPTRLAELHTRVFAVDRVRLLVMAPSRSILSKLEYPGKPLRKTANVKDLLTRVNVSIGAENASRRGAEVTLIQPNGDVHYITTDTIADYRTLSLSHLRWP